MSKSLLNCVSQVGNTISESAGGHIIGLLSQVAGPPQQQQFQRPSTRYLLRYRQHNRRDTHQQSHPVPILYIVRLVAQSGVSFDWNLRCGGMVREASALSAWAAAVDKQKFQLLQVLPLLLERQY
jgi:hypothetical protein